MKNIITILIIFFMFCFVLWQCNEIIKLSKENVLLNKTIDQQRYLEEDNKRYKSWNNTLFNRIEAYKLWFSDNTPGTLPWKTYKNGRLEVNYFIYSNEIVPIHIFNPPSQTHGEYLLYFPESICFPNGFIEARKCLLLGIETNVYPVTVESLEFEILLPKEWHVQERFFYGGGMKEFQCFSFPNDVINSIIEEIGRKIK
jgi:hypothetical protein